MWVSFGSHLVYSLPASKGLSYHWNYGSLLGSVLASQVLSGVLLVFNYNNSVSLAFSSVSFLVLESNWGFLLRLVHMSGASLFFVFLYLHLFRGLFFSSYRLVSVWLSGSLLLGLVMLSAFLGYVLPWAQMSFWAATVISSLLGVFPFVGEVLLCWVWSGFGVSSGTLGLFFSLHYLIPLLSFLFVVFHLLSLHKSGSTSSSGSVSSLFKIPFSPFFVLKDSLGVLVWLGFFCSLLLVPQVLGDVEMNHPANVLSSPLHIQPEWYFLYAYAVLRAVPNKLGGVLGLVLSVGVLFLLPLGGGSFSSPSVFVKVFLGVLVCSVSLLSWLGSCPVESPFLGLSQLFSFSFFFSFGVLLGFSFWVSGGQFSEINVLACLFYK